jgi:hypothetical protein
MDTSTESRPARRIRLPRRWWTRSLLAVAALAVVVAPAAWANHQFSDVPAASPHHDDISAIASVGITGGCAPGLYCPTQAVTRDQMASFIRRGLPRNGASGTTASVALTSAFQNLATDSITSGGAAGGGSGFVIVIAHFTAHANAGSLSSNHTVEYKVVQNSTGFESNVSENTLFANALTGEGTTTGAKMWVFSQPAGTTASYSLQARISFGAQAVGARSRLIQVLYVPFGPSGTSSPLGSPGAPGSASSPEQDTAN